ncbi:putative flap endonuclease-1-like 5' DNA nuclease/cell division protein FtsB [Lewinella marina]|uniref:Uncharacterized protein n=1 Tax=Neolewinella marina TaxID=438751 RepID=A0A2G0CBJ9_9BACT|nr:helix-hairpin-helix domain-containing protein [Neolewinella marina]NJB87138.1 putative flap endonuclease-1-like 5' DNA nuclease/cell division protein FtsB [Neolewinella marina]PHK97335.1 hypothetical protein CGL56_16140 [Neolewinella marina]
MPLIRDFIEYLATLTTQYLLIFALLGLLLFTLGLLLGWLVQRRKTSKFHRQLQQAGKEKEAIQQRLTAADEDQKSLARELVSITSEKDDILVQQREFRKNLDAISRELSKLQASNEQLNATNQSYASTIEDLNDQIIGLKTRNEQLLGGNAGAGQRESPPPSDAMGEVERRLRALEERVARLSPDQPEPVVDLGKPTHEVRIGPSLGEVIERRDDLTRIQTVGPFNQAKLYEAGIYTYDQIADWSEEDLSAYAARIGYVAELMREEDWIGQARKLADARQRDPEAQAPPVPARQGLLAVMGITPEIEAVLEDAGIRNLPTLAETPVEELEAMLQQAGGHMSVHDPASWPRQATLAAEGRWEELKQLQEEV